MRTKFYLIATLSVLVGLLVGCSSIVIEKPEIDDQVIGSRPYDYVVVHKGCGSPQLETFSAIFDKDTEEERYVSSSFMNMDGKWVLQNESLNLGDHTLTVKCDVKTGPLCWLEDSDDVRTFYVGDLVGCAVIDPDDIIVSYEVNYYGMYTKPLERNTTIYSGGGNVLIKYQLNNQTSEHVRFEIEIVFHKIGAYSVADIRPVDLPGNGIALVNHAVNLPVGSWNFYIRPVRLDDIGGDDTFPTCFLGKLQVERPFLCPEGKECCEPLPDGRCGSCQPICP